MKERERERILNLKGPLPILSCQFSSTKWPSHCFVCGSWSVSFTFLGPPPSHLLHPCQRSLSRQGDTVYVNLPSSQNHFFLGSKITADGDCVHEIKRRLLLGRKVMTNLDSVLRNRDITLPTNFHVVKTMVFPVVMYDVKVGLWRKLSAKELMLSNCDAGEDSGESLGLQGNQISQS